MAKLPDLFGRGVLASRPAAGIAGRHYFATDATPPTTYRDNGSSWDSEATAGAATVTTTRGDLIVRGAVTDARLAVGAADTVLKSDGTDPSWAKVLPANLDVSADNATANATAGHHGLLPKLSGSATDYLDGSGAWSAPAGGGGGGTGRSVLGHNAIGASAQNMTVGLWYLTKITAPSAGYIANVAGYLGETADAVYGWMVGVFADVAGAVGKCLLLGTLPGQYDYAPKDSAAAAPSWVARPGGVWVEAGDYWIGLMATHASSGSLTLAYDAGGADRSVSMGGTWGADATGRAQTNTTHTHSIRADFLTPGGPAGTSIDALKPGSMTDDFGGAALGGSWVAHSSQGAFALADCLVGVGPAASNLRMNFQEKMGALYVAHANTDFTMSCGLMAGLGGVTGAAAAMYGIAGLDSAGTGVALVAYNDGNAYLANITTWNYVSVLQTFAGSGHNNGGVSPYWLKLVRAANAWTGYVSQSGSAWGTVSGSSSVTITLDRLAIGMFYNTASPYRGAVEVDWVDIT
jgi:hypothetical protein